MGWFKYKVGWFIDAFCFFFFCVFFCFFFFQAEDGIRGTELWLEFRRVLFRSRELVRRREKKKDGVSQVVDLKLTKNIKGKQKKKDGG